MKKLLKLIIIISLMLQYTFDSNTLPNISYTLKLPTTLRPMAFKQAASIEIKEDGTDLVVSFSDHSTLVLTVAGEIKRSVNLSGQSLRNLLISILNTSNSELNRRVRLVLENDDNIDGHKDGASLKSSSAASARLSFAWEEVFSLPSTGGVLSYMDGLDNQGFLSYFDKYDTKQYESDMQIREDNIATVLKSLQAKNVVVVLGSGTIDQKILDSFSYIILVDLSRNALELAWKQLPRETQRKTYLVQTDASWSIKPVIAMVREIEQGQIEFKDAVRSLVHVVSEKKETIFPEGFADLIVTERTYYDWEQSLLNFIMRNLEEQYPQSCRGRAKQKVIDMIKVALKPAQVEAWHRVLTGGGAAYLSIIDKLKHPLSNMVIPIIENWGPFYAAAGKFDFEDRSDRLPHQTWAWKEAPEHSPSWIVRGLWFEKTKFKATSPGSEIMAHEAAPKIRALLTQAAGFYRGQQFEEAEKALIQAHRISAEFSNSVIINENLVPIIFRDYYALIAHHSGNIEKFKKMRHPISGLARRHANNPLARILLAALDFRLGETRKAELAANRVIRIHKKGLWHVDQALLEKADSILSLIYSMLKPRKPIQQRSLLHRLQYLTLADSLKELLDAFGWSAAELTRKSKLPPSTVKDLVSGRSKNANEDTLEILAKAFGHGITPRILRTPRSYPMPAASNKSTSAGKAPIILERVKSDLLFQKGSKRVHVPKRIIDRLGASVSIARSLNVELNYHMRAVNGTVEELICPSSEKEIVVLTTTLDEETRMNSSAYHTRTSTALRYLCHLSRGIIDSDSKLRADFPKAQLVDDFNQLASDLKEVMTAQKTSLDLYSVLDGARMIVGIDFIEQMVSEIQASPGPFDLIISKFGIVFSALKYCGTEWVEMQNLFYEERDGRPEIEIISVHNHPNGVASPPSAIRIEPEDGGEIQTYGDVYTQRFFNGVVSGLILETRRGNELFLFYEEDDSNEDAYLKLFDRFWENERSILPGLRKVAMKPTTIRKSSSAAIGVDLDQIDAEISRYRRRREGRNLAKAYQEKFTLCMSAILSEFGQTEDIVIFTYGSAGGQFMTAGSDTDIVTIVKDGAEVDIDGLQAAIKEKLQLLMPDIGLINFKSWQGRYVERLKNRLHYGRVKNELRSAKFICGDRTLFNEKIGKNHKILRLLSDKYTLLGSVLRADLYASWRSSNYGYGDVKDFHGGSRDVQAIYRAGLALTQDPAIKFVSQASPELLDSLGLLEAGQRRNLEEALDFLLVTKHILADPGNNNILATEALKQLSDEWQEDAKGVETGYRFATSDVVNIMHNVMGKVRKILEQDRSQEARRLLDARDSSDGARLRILIDTEDLGLCTTMALRQDLPATTREYLRMKIDQIYQKAGIEVNPELIKFMDWSEANGKSSSAGGARKELEDRLRRLERHRDFHPFAGEWQGAGPVIAYNGMHDKEIAAIKRKLGIDEKSFEQTLLEAFRSSGIAKKVAGCIKKYRTAHNKPFLAAAFNAALNLLSQRELNRILPVLLDVFGANNRDLESMQEASRESIEFAGSSKAVVVGLKGNVDFYPDLVTGECAISPGGEAYNAARVLSGFGADPSVFGFFGADGNIGKIFKGLLSREGVPTGNLTNTQGAQALYCSAVDGEPEPGNRTLGPRVSRIESERLKNNILAKLRKKSHMLIAGWLLPGMSPNFHIDLIRRAQAKGVITYFNTKDIRLLKKVISKSPPHIVSLNLDELCRLRGRKYTRDVDKIDAAENYAYSILKKGVKVVIVTLGRDGALLVTSDRAYLATVPYTRPVSTIGAGDALLGAFLYMFARQESLEDSLRFAVATAAATIDQPGTGVCKSLQDARKYLMRVELTEYIRCEIMGLRKHQQYKQATESIDSAA